jgi:hypothetical protein
LEQFTVAFGYLVLAIVLAMTLNAQNRWFRAAGTALGNRQKEGRKAFAPPQSAKATIHELASRPWDYSLEMVGLSN